MRLYDLLKDVKIRCFNVDLNTKINNIASDSRCVRNGDVFVAIRGEKRDGNNYISEAIKNGAIAIISDQKKQQGSVPYIFVKNAREALAKMWNAYYKKPTESLKIIAITGTNGKTSTAYILYSILRTAKKNCGLISTIECLINDKVYNTNGGSEISDIPSAMTTPDPSVLYRLFYEMKKEGVEYVVMEASSHALSQYKLSGASIYIGAFTNLSKEHLDFHKNINNYFESKKRLFKMCKYGIINIDDEYGKLIKKEHPDSYTFSVKSGANFYAEKIEFSDSDCGIFANLQGECVEIHSSLCGRFVPYNIMLAVSCAKLLKISNDDIRKGTYLCKNICGRLEKIKSNIYIDYAHTPKAIENVILSVKSIYKDKRLIALFGCGGDRDKSKRSIMGSIASKYCDEIIITSDNSRTENAIEIIKDIVAGIDNFKTHYIIPNRKEAVIFAVKKLKENEILLLLGKGHENYEIDNTGKHYFNEREIIEEVLKNVQN